MVSDLAQRVSARRAELGLSERALADRSGLSGNTIARVEDPTVDSSRIRNPTLDGLADGLEVSREDVYRWAGRRYSPPPALRGNDIEALARLVDNLTENSASLAKNAASVTQAAAALAQHLRKVRP